MPPSCGRCSIRRRLRPSGGPLSGPGNVVSGIALTATGRKEGLERFGASREQFLASLAPLVAFPLVGALLVAASGQPLLAGWQFLATLCGVLAPLAAAYELARFWGRGDRWLRFGTAYNWCQWPILLFALLCVGLVASALRRSLGESVAVLAAIGAAAAYGLWLHWFITRHTLDLSALRAALLVVLINVAGIVAVLGPALLAHRTA